MRWLLALSLALWCSAAPARDIVDLDPARQPISLASLGDWWLDTTGTATIGFVVSRPAAVFGATQDHRIYPLAPGQVLWIRFTLPPAPDAERWFVRLPNAGLDRVTLFTREPDGRWSAQTAGDLIPVARWPLPQLHPVFALAVSAADPGYYALRIEASNSFSTPILFERESHLSVHQQRVSLGHGLYFGLILMVVIFSLVSSVVMRDLAYVHFAAYGTVIMLAVASASGVGGMHLWNESPGWSDAAEYVLPILSFAPLLSFLALAVSLRARSRLVYVAVLVLAAAAIVMAGFAGTLPSPARLHLAVVSVCVFATTGLLTLAWAWRHGDRFARWLLLAFAPMLLALPFPVARALDWISVGVLTQHAVQLSVALSLPLLFLLLILRSQERRDYRRRITALDHADPLTGLVNDRVFEHRLRGLIERSSRFQHLGAVVFVDIQNLPRISEEFGRKVAVEVLVRLAGRLAAMARDVDTVARLGETRFGLLLEGPVPPERLKGFASKVLTRCITPFSRLPNGVTVRPRIAGLLLPLHASDAHQAIVLLDAMLLQASPDHRKSIFIADMSGDSEVVTAPMSI